jgi:hypothetical protein
MTLGTVATQADFLEMLLPRRRDRAQTYVQLASRMYGDPLHPVTDVEKRRQRSHIRHLYELVRELRLRGVPVCGEDGLWRAETAAEAMDAYRSLRRRALNQIDTASALKATAFRMKQAEESVEPLTLGLVAA